MSETRTSTDLSPVETEDRRIADLRQLALDYARAGETESLEYMLKAGLPVDLADHSGNTLLMLASFHGHLDAVAMLLKRGADVNRKNERGQTSLGGVSLKGYVGIAELLLARGASIGGMTPVMFASLFGRPVVIGTLHGHEEPADSRRHGAFGGWLNWLSGIPSRIFRRKRSASAG